MSRDPEARGRTFSGPDQRQECDGGSDAAKQVDVDHVVEILKRAPLDLGPVGDPGVVHHGPQTWEGRGQRSRLRVSRCFFTFSCHNQSKSNLHTPLRYNTEI